jgi:gliding motility-associated-like protein
MTIIRKFGIILFGIFLSAVSFARGHEEVAVQFHANKGQWPKQVLYRAVTPGGAVFIEPTGLTYVISSGGAHLAHGRAGYIPDQLRMHAYKVHFEGGVAASHQGTHRMEHYVNYFLGDDPSAWAGGVPVFAGVDLREVYPGIGVRIDGQTGLKYDWLVAPGANAAQIVMRYEGADKLAVNAGLLFVSTSAGQVVEQRPVAWQTVHGTRRPVECRYALKGETVSFDFPYGYDKRYPLVIDPVVVFSSYSGSTGDNFGFTATYDNGGHLYGGGMVRSPGYPLTVGVLQPNYGGGENDMAVSKFTPTGTALVWSTYIGGSSNEVPHSMVVNSNDELYILGTTNSTNFPVTTGCWLSSFQGGVSPPFPVTSYGFTYTTGSDIVVLHLNSDATALIGSTYVGGSGNDGLNQQTPTNRNYGDPFRGEIILDLEERPMVITSTASTDLFTTPNAVQASFGGSVDAYVFRMDPELSDILWATYYGGAGVDAGFGIQTSSTGEIYITGGTTSTNLPSAGIPANPGFQGGTDGFIARFNPSGAPLLSTTYVGTSGFDQSYFVQLNTADEVFVVGQTTGPYPITPGKYNNPNATQFLHKFSADLSTSLWSTRIGGAGSENISPSAFLVSNCGQIYFSGWAGSTNAFGSAGLFSSTDGLPVTSDAFQSTTSGSDFYLMMLELEAVALGYATFFGGNSAEHVDGGTSRFDKDGIVYQAVCAGCSQQSYPTTPGVWSNTNNSDNCNLGVFKIDFEQGVQVSIIANVSDLTICLDDAVTFDAVGSANTWIWDLGDGSPLVQGGQVTHQYETGGEYTVMLVGVDSLSCNLADTAYATVTVVAPQVMEPGFEAVPLSDCQGYSIEFFNTSFGGDSYLWNFGDGATSTQTNPVHAYTGPGTYTITLSVIDALCQNSVDTVQVVVLEPPTLEIELDPLAALCEGASVILDAGPGFDTYSWSTGATTPTITVSSVGTFSITVTEGVCTGSTSIEVVAQPVPPRAEDVITCPGQDALLSAPFAVNSIVWSSGDTTTSILADQAGDYWFVAVDTVGCTVRDTIAVTLITVEQSTAIIPNVFSPNGDGKNDTFQVDGLFLEEFNMEVLNRWGQTIYETDRADRGWNGGQNNTSDKAPEGTYFYVITFKDRCSSEPSTTRTGHVTLVR